LRPDGFWFMEMNTRLQVEHPVTEAITGVDLVEWQLRVAAGESLPCAQEGLTISGHSFEARLYAEDVPAGFLPATGRLAHLAFPESARADTGVRTGDVISPHYDPMIAKVIVHGPSRAVALRKLRRALAETHVAGTVTNLSFLGALARHEGFSAGDVDTGLIGRELESLIAVSKTSPILIAQGVLTLFGLDKMPCALDGFTLWQPLAQAVSVSIEQDIVPCRLVARGPGKIDVTVNDTVVQARYGANGWRYDGQPASAIFVEDGSATVFGDQTCVVRRVDPLDVEAGAGGSSDLIEAPMPGLVRQVFVEAGQTVTKGDRLAVLEAMKMEHSLLAARDGEVAEVMAENGAQVEAGAVLIRLQSEQA
ncbi:MAG: 3-methylcrotonyl-CoA carboxylase, partial [Marivita sp. XM-24bin2]